MKEIINGRKSVAGVVVKHINKEVAIKHGTETEFHLLIDFGKYGKKDLHVTTECYFDCIDGKTYYWDKNIYELSDTLHPGWQLVGFSGIGVLCCIGIYFLILFAGWLFNFKPFE